MASNIDATVPATGSVVAKADLRSNFSYAKSEIEALQSGKASLGANVFTGTQDFNGQQVEAALMKVVTSVSGTLTTTAHAGNIIKTSGNITVPTTAGFTCTVIAGGAHTITFNSTSCSALASGDIVNVIVESSSVIHAAKLASADKLSFS